MRSKDRLAELHRRMAESGGVYHDTVERAGAGPEATLAPHIDNMLREVERMRGWIHEMNGNTQLVRRLHSDPTYHNNKQLQEQLDAAASATEALGARVCGALQALEAGAGTGAGAGAGAGAGPNSAGARMCRLQYAATRALLGGALEAHHTALTALRDHQRDLLLHQIQLTNLTLSDEECESLLESKDLSLFVDNVAADTAAARSALRAVEARRAELARAERGVRAVRDLFALLALRLAAQVRGLPPAATVGRCGRTSPAPRVAAGAGGPRGVLRAGGHRARGVRRARAAPGDRLAGEGRPEKNEFNRLRCCGRTLRAAGAGVHVRWHGAWRGLAWRCVTWRCRTAERYTRAVWIRFYSVSNP